MSDEDIIPGTKRLYDDDGNALSPHSELKKHGDIVLAPQPTDHPDDPLHWGLKRKLWHALLLLLITALTGATTNDSGSAQFQENAELGISYNSFNVGAGVLFIGIGYWTLLISPAVWLYGRRIPYLICLCLGVIGGIWFAKGEHTADAIWNQLFVGASESCSEANVQLSLMDIFFQHQRGAVLGAYMLAISAGTFLGPLIANYIGSSMGWRWIGWFGAIFNGLLAIVCLFGLEETSFDRNAYSIVDGINSADLTDETKGDKSPEASNEKADSQSSKDIDVAPINVENDGPMTRKSYRQRIALITLAPNVRGTGFKQYFSRLFHTLRVFTFPAVWFAGLQWGAQDAWLTFYLTTEDDNWTEVPWSYGSSALGIMNLPCLLGAVIGCAYGGWFSDHFMRWMTKCNGGIQEAEFRLYLLLPATILFPIGMLLFGIGSAHEWAWPGVYVGLGFIGFGWGNAGDLSMGYLEDCYPNMVLEGMVGVAVINNTIGMIFTFGADPWLETGLLNTWIAIGVLSFVFMATTLPMALYGKACRRWTSSRYERFLILRDGL
ncbi:putative MFS-type transporter [Hyphodiscus hymeniophilus]|uniref:MFS-type transporter n=1 Tax=Hyphodiscus hymeniophilus TaxID=353542 RepID=A0A9P7AY67_9HELO|nr:putative MFS-type transporter [Hyphodiscus hymeniophilus]